MDLTSKILASRLLTESEKSYWTENLSRMTPDQRKKLDEILGEAESVISESPAQDYLPILMKANAALA